MFGLQKISARLYRSRMEGGGGGGVWGATNCCTYGLRQTVDIFNEGSRFLVHRLWGEGPRGGCFGTV